jgi:hypothetical protein
METVRLRHPALFWGGDEDAHDPHGSLGPVPDEVADLLVDELFRKFRFATREFGPAGAQTGLGPEVAATLLEQATAGRHEKGSYYTPRPVVAFMVRQALGAYLEARLPREQRGAVARLVERRDPEGLRDRTAALEVLQRLRMCDPSCGGGAFLVGMLEELVTLRRCLGDRGGRPGRLREEILQNNLHGVDLEPEAVEVARLRLRLGLLGDWEGETLPAPPEERILVGDSLLDFDWRAHFPKSFADGGFDLVLMNPPYLLPSRVPGHARESFRRYSQQLRLRHGFSGDLYVHFFYLGLRLLKAGGVLGALTSASFLTNATKEHLRRELLRHHLRLVAPLGPDLFDARVYPAITLVRKSDEAGEASKRPSAPFRKPDTLGRGLVSRRPVPLVRAAAGVHPTAHGGDLEPASLSFLDLRQVSAEELLEPGLVMRRAAPVDPEEYRGAVGCVFFEPTPENRWIFREMLAATGGSRPPVRRFVRLGEVAPALDTGIHSGNVRGKLFYREPVPGKTLHRLLQGTQVVRYGVWWENPEARYRYVDLGYRVDPSRNGTGRAGRSSAHREYWHFCGSMENHHVAERLLMRQTADSPFVGHLWQGEEQIYTDNTLHTLLLTPKGRELGFSYPFLLALLNSAPVARIYRALAQEEGRMLAQVKTTVVNLLPLPVPKGGDAEELETLVGRVQDVYRAAGFPLPEKAAEEVAAIQRAMDRAVARLYGPIE